MTVTGSAQVAVGRLGDIIEVIMGQSPVGTSYNRDRNGAPLINGPTEFTRRYPVAKQWTTAPVRLCRPNDILICVRGSSTGRINTADAEYCIGRGVAAVRARGRNDQSFAFHALSAVVEQLLKLQTGSTFPSIDSKVIKGGKIRVPDPPEQRAIARALDDADDFIATMERLIAKKRTIKQGVMQQLLAGRIRLAGFEDTWLSTNVGELLEFKNGLNKAAQYFGSGSPIVNFMDVMQGPIITANDVRGLVTLTRDEIKRFSAKRDDILFTRTSETVDEVGTAAALVDDIPNAVFSGFILRGRPRTSETDSRFIAYLFQLDSIRKQVTATATYTTRALTNGRSLSRVAIALPSFYEQRAIADVIANSSIEIATLHARLSKVKAVKQGMMQELLTGRTRLPIGEAAW